jgi:outer membrane protein assembly factor BamE
MKRLALSTILLLTGALLASGCVYKMSIQQGNYLVAESVSQLKEGMTRSQVRFLLGTPMVPTAFDNSRWDYYYFFRSKQYPKPLQRRLTVYFEDERVQRYENQGVPTETDLKQLDADLQKAIAATKKNERKPSVWQRMTGRGDAATSTSDTATSTTGAAGNDVTPPPSPKTATEEQAAQPPDPVPASQPLPAPAGTPSGQQ